MQSRVYSTNALFLGRALHGPWNEGTRVIGRNVAVAASSLRPVQVVSLTQERFRGAAEEAFPIRHVYTPGGYNLVGDYTGLRGMLQYLNELTRTTKIGVAHLVGLPMALAPWLRMRGVRIVYHVTLANQVYSGAVERMRASLGWRVFDRWIDTYALSSEALRAPLLDRGLSPKKISVIPAPIDTDCYQPAEQRDARARFGLSGDELVVVYVGTLSPLRFPAETIRAALIEAGARVGKPIRLFGFAPAVTHDYNREWSQQVAQQLSGIHNVRADITLGDLSDEQKRAWFQAADAVLLPFTSAVAVEPPLTMLEAMACGAITVVTPHANRSEIVRHDVNGMTYSRASELAENLVKLARLREQRNLHVLKAAARETIVEQYSIPAAAASSARVWESIENGADAWR